MISVCMATFNGGKYVREQIESILPQLDISDELIISDDGSSDGTLPEIKKIGDGRIKLYNNGGKHGFVGNFENALLHSKGDVIFLCDQDDVWAENKVQVSLSYLELYDLIVHDAEIIDGDGRKKGFSYYSIMHKGTGFFMNFWKTRFLGCCMAFRRCVMEYFLPIPEKVIAHDYWIGMLSLTKFNVKFVPDVLILYRRHGENFSPSGGKSTHSLFFKLFTKRAVLIFEIVKRKMFLINR